MTTFHRTSPSAMNQRTGDPGVRLNWGMETLISNSNYVAFDGMRWWDGS